MFNLKKIWIMKKSVWEILLKVIVAAVTAALTAIGTTSCMGHGPINFWTTDYTDFSVFSGIQGTPRVRFP